MKEQAIIWFQDSVKLRSPKKKWGEIDMLTERLIGIIGHPAFEHRIIKPEVCMRLLREQLLSVDWDFSVVVDLGGFRHWTEDFLPNLKPVLSKFHLSRVRNVTSPRLDGCGHLLALNPVEVERIRTKMDMTRPLFLDDVGWSGRTCLEAVKALGASSSIFGFLVANTGDFGEGKPGATQLLEDSGAKVVTGQFVETPRDDGFHLSDFFDHPFISEVEVFSTIVRIQELREELMVCDDTRRKQVEQEIKSLLINNRSSLFPNSKGSEEMKQLQAEGRFISSGGIPKNSFFDVNPPNWLMPSFSRRVRSDMLKENTTQIVDTLIRLRDVLDVWRFL